MSNNQEIQEEAARVELSCPVCGELSYTVFHTDQYALMLCWNCRDTWRKFWNRRRV